MNSDIENSVCFYSEPNFLAISLLENLLANNCFVNIVTDDVYEWQKKTLHIAAKNKFSIGNNKIFQKNINFKYIIFCSGFFKKDFIIDDVKKFLRQINLQKTKTFMIFPKEVYETTRVSFSETPDSLGIIYLGDLLGPRMDLESDLKMPVYLKKIVTNKIFKVPVGEILFPVLASDVAKQIVKWLYAFGPFGKETFLLGPETSSGTFWQINTKLVGEIKYITNTEDFAYKDPKNIEIFRIEKDTRYMLSETYNWLNSNKIRKDVSKNTTTNSKRNTKITNSSFGNIGKTLTFLLIIFLFPIVTSLISVGVFYLSLYNFRLGRDETSLRLLYTGKTIAQTSYFGSRVLKHIPLTSIFYKETEFVSQTLINISEVGEDTISLVRKSSSLLSNILNNNPYSVAEVVGGFEPEFLEVYKNISLLEENTIRFKNEGSLVAGVVLEKIDFDNYKNLTYQLTSIMNKLPFVLGENESKTYLILLKNNMELRPAGGFIDSFGIVKFDKGRLSEITINDIYSADDQLKGHVEPPSPIRKYLGETNWWFRDSNWDPDFPTSARRAEWFLDKEMSQTVDGVFSVDLKPMRDFLGINGAIFLTGYNTNITSDNLYEKLQSETQVSTASAADRKISFLTSLSRTVFAEIKELSPQQRFQFLKTVYNNFNEKHIQIFLHDTDFQKNIKALGWDGSVFVPTCGIECNFDLVGVVEANIGANMSNLFIKREIFLDVNIDSELTENSLVLNLQNSANSNLNMSGRYKTYVRFLIPEKTTVVDVIVNHGQTSEKLLPDITVSRGYKEVGVLVEVLAGEKKQLIINWITESFRSTGQYNLLFRKQSGVDSYPITMRIKTPFGRILASSPTFSLTEEGHYIYNSTLVRDINVRFSF